MGAGKKELASFGYGRSSTRSLAKCQLGGVIFGASKITINECLSKQLFGLPSQHFLYVEKIDPGLPLFLFNYTDRTLHGIFEAASSGKMNIDPYAWNSNGSQRTPYPAQVQICVRLQCRALTENQFKPAIMDNYYAENHFWFELDHAQTSRLLSLLSSQVVSAPPSPLAPHRTMKWKPLLPFRTKSDNREENERVCHTPLEVVGGHSVHSSGKGTSNGGESSLSVQKDVNCLNGSSEQSSDDFLGKIGKEEKELIYMQLKDLVLRRKLVDPPADCENDNAAMNNVTLERNGSSGEVVVHNEKKEDIPASSNESPTIAQLIEKMEDLMAIKTEQNHKICYLEQKIVSLEQNLVEAKIEIKNLKDHCVMLETMVGPPEEFDNIKGRESPSENHLDSSPEGSDIFLGSDDLILLVGGYDGVSWLSSLDCYSPSQNLIKSLTPMNTKRCNAPASVLDGEVYVFGGGTGGLWYDTVESYDPVENQWTTRPPLNKKRGSLAGATVKDKIYAVGGGSGEEFYSYVEFLDLDVGEWLPTRSMRQKRFSLAAAELNGVMYAVGGYDGENYLKTVERFDPRELSWKKIESMNTPRGCPSLVALNEKLYVLGGFDGYEMIPTVEIYDTRRGSWMIGEPMNYPRGFSAAAVVKESIYVFGGLKNREEINDTVECYKEGQGWEIIADSAVRRRCFHSAVAL